MSVRRTSQQVFEEEFLTLRARILELAAALDRIDRAEPPCPSPEKRATLCEAIHLLQSSEPNRAEQVQLLWSRSYCDDWREKMEI